MLACLLGSGGTGKSVLTAVLMSRVSERVVAWHFCRHDDKEKSAPAALLRSLAAMLCHRLPGYDAALGEVSAALLSSTDPKELFEALFEKPLAQVAAPLEALLIIIDALDEIPKEEQKALLDLITKHFIKLPPWLRLFVTSREEAQIQKALAPFKPMELRADETRNRADVEVKLRNVARKHVRCGAPLARAVRPSAPCSTPTSALMSAPNLCLAPDRPAAK